MDKGKSLARYLPLLQLVLKILITAHIVGKNKLKKSTIFIK